MASSSVAQAEDEELSEAVFGSADITEGNAVVVLDAVLAPEAHDLAVGGAGFGCGGIGGLREDSAEISCEAGSGGR